MFSSYLLAAIITSGSDHFETYTFLLNKNIVQQFNEITVLVLVVGVKKQQSGDLQHHLGTINQQNRFSQFTWSIERS